ncbi:MAG: FtsQ-type POTRA domain-containing protein [Romboutsia sp.]
MDKNKNKNKKKRKKISIGKLMPILVFIFIATFGVAIFLNSSYFNLEKVEITGEKGLSEDEILESIDLAKNKNIFSYNTKAIKNKLIENPYVEDVNIKLKLPNTMNINVDEKRAIALLKNNENYCYISKDGEVLEKVEKIEKNNDKIIVDIDYNYNNEFVKFKNDESEKRLLYLIGCLDDKNIYDKIYEINLRDENITNIMTRDYTKVIISNDDKLDYNVSRLEKIILDLNAKNKKNGTIDLTYNNYALYSP